MKNITKMLAVAGILCVSTFTFAQGPARCPSVHKIKQVNLSLVDAMADKNLYGVAAISKYGTNFTWAFAIGVPMDQAINNQDAMNKANAALATLSGTPQPIHYEKQWICIYGNHYAYMAFAVTPIK